MVQSVASVVAEVAQTGPDARVAVLVAEVAFSPAYAAVAAVGAEVAGVFPAPPPSAAVRSLTGLAPGNAIGGW